MNPEVQLISVVLNTADMSYPLECGVSTAWFHSHQKEWKFLENHSKKYGKVPGVALFSAKFNSFRLVKGAMDIEPAVEDLRAEHGKKSFLLMMDDLLEQLEDTDTPLEIINNAHSQLSGLIGALDNREAESDLVEDWNGVYSEVSRRVRRLKKKGMAGIPSGFEPFDTTTGGFQPGEIWVFGARLKQGKTWMLIRMAVEALMQGYTVQYNALEQSKNAIAIRFHAILSQRLKQELGKGLVFSASSLVRGHGLDLNDYKEWLAELPSKVPGKLIINDTSRGRLTAPMVDAQIDRNAPDIVFIDYVGLMAKNRGDWTQVADLSSDLKGIAVKRQIPLVVAAQINRGGDSRKSPPSAADLSGSDAIGQDCDGLVTFVRRSQHITMMALQESRNSESSVRWWVHFDPDNGTVEHVTGDDAERIMDKDEDVKDED